MTDKSLPPPDKSEATLEQQLQAMGLNAPRVTEAMVDSMIERVEYFALTDTHTLCKITMFGGRFSTTGESSAVSKENFNYELSEQISYRKARAKVWPIAGAVLANDLHNYRMPLSEEHLKLDQGVQRVILELKEVTARLEGLAPLVADTKRLADQGCDEEEIKLLVEQTVHLSNLKDVLQKRLSRIGV